MGCSPIQHSSAGNASEYNPCRASVVYPPVTWSLQALPNLTTEGQALTVAKARKGQKWKFKAQFLLHVYLSHNCKGRKSETESWEIRAVRRVGGRALLELKFVGRFLWHYVC